MMICAATSYDDIVWPLVLLIFARCTDHGDGVPEFEHFAENDFQEASDVLCRLGLMTDKNGSGLCHVFPRNWVPKKPMALECHAGAPTAFDLVLVLCFLIDWDAGRFCNVKDRTSSSLDELMKDLDLRSDDWSDRSSRHGFHAFAVLTGCRVLEDLGLGSWTSGGKFKVLSELSSGSATHLMDIYRQSRVNIANKLGGEDKLYPKRPV